MKKFKENLSLLKELAPILKEVGPLLNEIGPLLKEAAPLLKEAAPFIKDAMKEIGPGIKEAIDEAGPAVREAIPELLEAIREEKRRREREQNGEDEVDDEEPGSGPIEYGTGRLFNNRTNTEIDEYEKDLQRALQLSKAMSQGNESEINNDSSFSNQFDSYDSDLQRVLELSRKTSGTSSYETSPPSQSFSPYDDDDVDLQRALKLSEQTHKEQKEVSQVSNISMNSVAIDPLTGRIMSVPGPAPSKKEEENDEKKGEEKMEMLKVMGFVDETKNRIALEMYNYDLQRAANHLMMD